MIRIGRNLLPRVSPAPARNTAPANVATRPAPVRPQTVDAFTGPAKTPTRTPDPNQPDVGLNGLYGRDDFAQGATNSCGTTSLAIILERLGIRVPRKEIDDKIREFNTATSMDDIVEYARGKGLQAESYNGGNFDTLRNELAAGRQIMVLTDVERGPDGKLVRGSEGDMNLHYMVVTEAFEKDGKKYVTYQNPWGVQQTVPWERFDQLWSNLHMFGMETGWDHSYILIDKAGAKPLPGPGSDFEMEAANAVAHAMGNVTNGVADLGKGRILQGVTRLFAGVIGGAAGLVGNLFNVPGRWLDDVGASWRNTASNLLSSSNWFSKIGGVFVGGAGYVVSGIGKAAEAVGNGVAWLGNTAAKGVEAVGGWIGGAASAVGNFFSSIF